MLRAKKIQIKLAGGDEPRAVAVSVVVAAGGGDGAGPRVSVRRGWSPAPVRLGGGSAAGGSRSGQAERLGRADGGDGGEDPWLLLEGREAGHQPKNTDEYLTFARLDDCVPTRDLADRAHKMKGADGKLIASTAGATIGRPRRYPPCCMTTAGVAHDSMFDRTAELQRELIGIPGIGADSCPSMSKAVRNAMDQMRGRLGADGLRKVTRWGATRLR